MRWTACAVAVLLTVAGCASTTTAGDPVAAPASTAAAPTTVDVAQLDPGVYSTQPLTPLGEAGNADVGRRVEGQRMAEFVVGPWQADPALTQPGASSGSVLLAEADIGFFVWPFVYGGTLGRPFVVGFFSERSSTDAAAPSTLRNGVLRFATPDDAAGAAAGMTDGALNMPVVKGMPPVLTEPAVGVPIPGHPDTRATLLTFSEADKTVQEITVVTARGPYVLVQVARSAQGPGRAAETVGRVLDLQVPLIDRFTPTDPAEFAWLPRDPTGLVARTVPLPPAEAAPMSGAAYPPAGALHAAADPLVAGPEMTAAGVDQVSLGLTTVYQAADTDRARELATTLGDGAANQPASQPAPPIAGLPVGSCTRVAGPSGLIPKYQCVAPVDRYVITSSARDLDRAHQQATAQYLMLAG